MIQVENVACVMAVRNAGKIWFGKIKGRKLGEVGG